MEQMIELAVSTNLTKYENFVKMGQESAIFQDSTFMY